MVAIISIYVLILAIVVSDAYADAFIDVTRQRDHIIEVINIALYLIVVWVFSVSVMSIWHFLLLYTFIRIYAFNFTYNKIRDLPEFYLGKTDAIWDRWLSFLPIYVYIAFLCLSFFFSLSIPLYYIFH